MNADDWFVGSTGASCTYYYCGNGIGAKIFDCPVKALYCYWRQCLAAQHGLGPTIGSMFARDSKRGFFVEHLALTGDVALSEGMNQFERLYLAAQLREKLWEIKLFDCDILGPENTGWRDPKADLLAIDLSNGFYTPTPWDVFHFRKLAEENQQQGY